MINKPGPKWLLYAVVLAWAATSGVAITFAGSPSDNSPSVSDNDLTRSADEAAKSGEYATALRLYRQLAEKGNARAQYILGRMYDESVPPDIKEAVKWYQLAAAQGYAEAQYKLGTMYEDGKGVPQDKTEAVKWYQLAAAQGYAKAQYRLAPPTPTCEMDCHRR